MDDKPVRLNDRFRLMWDKDSPMQQEWKNFETLSWVIHDLSLDLAVRSSAFPNLHEVDAAIQGSTKEMGQLFLETLVFLWNRLLLRTCLKVSDSLELMFFSMNAANAYGCAVSGRCVIE